MVPGKLFNLCFDPRVGEIVEAGESHGVNLDGIVNDELHAGEADAIGGKSPPVHRRFGAGNIEHDLGSCFGEIDKGNLAFLKRKEAGINFAFLAERAVYGDGISCGKFHGGIAGPDDGGDIQLTAYDGGMAGASAMVGDDGGGFPHERDPVGVGSFGDKDLPFLEFPGIGEAFEDNDRAGSDAVTDGETFDKGSRCFFIEVIAADDGGVFLGLDCFGAGLDDEEFLCPAIEGPLDIHGASVVLFDLGRPAGKLQNLVIIDAEAGLIRLGRFNGANTGIVLVTIDHLDGLGAELSLDDGSVFRVIKEGLEDAEFIRCDRSLHNGLSLSLIHI